MFDTFLIASAHAQTATPAVTPAAPAGGDVLMQFMPLILIFVVFYFLLIRPQQKRMKEHNELLKALKKGDKVVTGGGIVGTITKVEGDDYLFIDIASGVEVKALRATVTGLVDPTKKPANDSKKAA
jgi:preprotein translocase subunit YajC